MALHNIQSALESIKNDATLCEEANFGQRAAALDGLEFLIIDRIDGLLATAPPSHELLVLKQHAESLRQQLEAVDERLFQRLRQEIALGDCRGVAFQHMLDRYVGHHPHERKRNDEPGYDLLDLFVNGLLLAHPLPDETQEREPEMVFYQQTPARIILELAAKLQPAAGTVFYDLGSGLGHVPMLVHLLTEMPTRGVEWEPAYWAYAQRCAAELNLQGVTFITADARSADYNDGTIFFLYTPFEGWMLQEVLRRLRREADSRPIWLASYGPCSATLARQPWLTCAEPGVVQRDRLMVWKSRET
ncbi:MAG: class I SAM-dependent methyltransferase [Chloroflexaceae bacterium]|jgi:hypothetical protein|nr:class I SAM-dependent methyltransferase [Chloroflexaceae bacterium]